MPCAASFLTDFLLHKPPRPYRASQATSAIQGLPSHLGHTGASQATSVIQGPPKPHRSYRGLPSHLGHTGTSQATSVIQGLPSQLQNIHSLFPAESMSVRIFFRLSPATISTGEFVCIHSLVPFTDCPHVRGQHRGLCGVSVCRLWKEQVTSKWTGKHENKSKRIGYSHRLPRSLWKMSDGESVSQYCRAQA